jgi:hypothetical protein
MAINARITTSGTIGRATIRQPSRSSIVSQNFQPKPNVSLNEIIGVTTIGAQNGYALIYDSAIDQFKPESIEAATTIQQITGGTF